MNLTSRADVEAPIDFVFSSVSDFHSFERQALRRGADVKRRSTEPEPGLGASWDVSFKYRGKDRVLVADITEFDKPNGYVVEASVGGLVGETRIDLVALSRRRTRLTVTTELLAQGLTARLLLQSLKLARTTMMKRIDTRVASFAADIENRFARQS